MRYNTHKCEKEEFVSALPSFLSELFFVYDEGLGVDDEVFIFDDGTGIVIQVYDDKFVYALLSRKDDQMLLTGRAYAEDIYDEKWYTAEEGFRVQSCWMYTVEDLKNEGYL